jgi:hypothetical protein
MPYLRTCATLRAFKYAEVFMETQIVYAFMTGQQANRFLNALKVWNVADVQVKLFRGADKVKVSYYFSEDGFDATSSQLDELAEVYGGKELL